MIMIMFNGTNYLICSVDVFDGVSKLNKTKQKKLSSNFPLQLISHKDIVALQIIKRVK